MEIHIAAVMRRQPTCITRMMHSNSNLVGNKRNAMQKRKPKHYESLESQLENLKKEFPSFMKKLKGTNKDFSRGKITSIREVHPSHDLVRGFCSVGARREKKGRRKGRMKMAILFHGTHQDCVNSIVRDGIYDMSHFTNNLHYAVRRAQYKSNFFYEESQVLVFAVLVDEEKARFDWNDVTTCSPCRDYALPLFIITIRDTNVRFRD